jgi:hypothetical protein
MLIHGQISGLLPENASSEFEHQKCKEAVGGASHNQH